VRESHGARNRTSASLSAGPGRGRREEGEGGGRREGRKRKGGESRNGGERETKGKGHGQRERERREVNSRRWEGTTKHITTYIEIFSLVPCGFHEGWTQKFHSQNNDNYMYKHVQHALPQCISTGPNTFTVSVVSMVLRDLLHG